MFGVASVTLKCLQCATNCCDSILDVVTVTQKVFSFTDWEQQNEETATPYAEKSLTDLISNHIVWENEQKKPKNMEQMSIELQHEWQLHDVINEKNNLKSVLEETKGTMNAFCSFLLTLYC